MIALRSDCLMFELATGESVPCSVEMISIEITGGKDALIDPEALRHAAASVFHYFKNELNRHSVTVGEFASALERVLRRLGFTLQEQMSAIPAETVESDLRIIACRSAGSLELFFYAALRHELRSQLRQSPKLLRFHGLRGCVKQIAGAQRWSDRCDRLQDQIVGYLRECLSADRAAGECSLVVE